MILKKPLLINTVSILLLIVIILINILKINGDENIVSPYWPKPQSLLIKSDQVIFDMNNFQFIITNFNSNLLKNAINRYEKLIFINNNNNKKFHKYNNNMLLNCKSLEINITTSNENLDFKMNENYTLLIQSPTSYLTANTIWGALRGLETFSQAIEYNDNNQYVANITQIIDFPRFHHRGVMIDTARHWLPLDIIYQHLDAMSYNKFNVLHWHIVDNQAFPFVSQSFPNLSVKGAYDSTHIYSPDDVQNVILYARERGIRVVVEFDTPGHTFPSWGKGVPGILTNCYDKNGNIDGVGPLNPTSDVLWTFLSLFFAEVARVFPDEYLHLGGDEVSFSCWASNPTIQKWMAAKNWTDYALLEQYYEVRLLELIGSKPINRSYIVWQEIFDNGLKIKEDTVIHVWKNHWQSEMFNVTKAGYNTIVSSPWYLNYISYGSDWPTYYNVEPTDFNGTDAQKSLVLGGETCLWGEYIDATNAISRTWPRAAAIAERLWSASNVRDINNAQQRMHINRCRLLQRDISAEPPNGPSFCKHEWIKPYNPPFLRHN